jgi:hypothetical protein
MSVVCGWLREGTIRFTTQHSYLHLVPLGGATNVAASVSSSIPHRLDISYSRQQRSAEMCSLEKSSCVGKHSVAPEGCERRAQPPACHTKPWYPMNCRLPHYLSICRSPGFVSPRQSPIQGRVTAEQGHKTSMIQPQRCLSALFAGQIGLFVFFRR